MKRAIAVQGTTAMLVKGGPNHSHRLPPGIASLGLPYELNKIYGAGWYAVVIEAGGHATLAGSDHDTSRPIDDVLTLMLDVARRLNRELHHDGHWLVVWHREQRLCLVWRDHDAAIQFTDEWSEPWTRVKKLTVSDICQVAETAWQKWKELVAGVDVRPEQMTIKPDSIVGRHFRE